MNKTFVRTSQLACLALSISVLGWSEGANSPVFVANLATDVYKSNTPVYVTSNKTYMHRSMGGGYQSMSTDINVGVVLASATAQLNIKTILTTNGNPKTTNVDLYKSLPGTVNPLDAKRNYCVAIQYFANIPIPGYVLGIYSYGNTYNINQGSNDPNNLRIETILGTVLTNQASLYLTQDGLLQLVMNGKAPADPSGVLWTAPGKPASAFYNISN